MTREEAETLWRKQPARARDNLRDGRSWRAFKRGAFIYAIGDAMPMNASTKVVTFRRHQDHVFMGDMPVCPL